MAGDPDRLALPHLHPGSGECDQALQQPALGAVAGRSLPQPLPGLMRFPVKAVIEKVDAMGEQIARSRRAVVLRPAREGPARNIGGGRKRKQACAYFIMPLGSVRRKVMPCWE